MLASSFIVLAGVATLAGLVALWQSLRTAFGGGPGALTSGDAGLPGRQALIAEKNTLLRAIKDIAFERELGKFSDEDFERLDKAYRGRAKKVLHLLDQDIEPFLEKADRAVAEAMDEEGARGPYRRRRATGKSRQKAAKARRRSAARGSATRGRDQRTHDRDPDGLPCASCGVLNDADAVHCKGCAARIAPIECPRCDTENDPDAKFCKSCAEPLGARPKPEPEPEPEPAAEEEE